MTGKDELRRFEKMWTWLSDHPKKDRKYYLKHVVELEEMCLNNCPLSNSKQLEKCSGCQLLWDSTQGNLCTDSGAPLFKWKNTERHQLGKRSSYARKVAALAMKSRSRSKLRTERCSLHRKTALGHPLPLTHRHQWGGW